MFDPAQLVFVDETWTSTSMVRLRGRCPRGERLIGYPPQGHWKVITLSPAAAKRIEPGFSKFKAHLRRAAERTIPHLVRRIGRVVPSHNNARTSFVMRDMFERDRTLLQVS